MMWQNGGMSGIDHWNFVMHPVDAAHTCDPNGDYVRKWVSISSFCCMLCETEFCCLRALFQPEKSLILTILNTIYGRRH